QSVQKMNCPRPRSGTANTEFAGELAVRARHERGHCLMAHLHEIELVLELLQRRHEVVDAVAGKTVNPLHPPLDQTFCQKVADCFSHLSPFGLGHPPTT